MTFYADLAPCGYFDPVSSGKLKAVGWLSRDQSHARGSTPPDVIAKLEALLHHAWAPCLFNGWHDCELCPPERTGSERRHRNLFVPGAGFLYVAPELLLHYVRDHDYAPPPEFVAAVQACPEMNSPAYVAAIRANGPAVIREHALSQWTYLGAVEPRLEQALIEASPATMRKTLRVALEVACREVELDGAWIERALAAVEAGGNDAAVEDEVYDRLRELQPVQWEPGSREVDSYLVGQAIASALGVESVVDVAYALDWLTKVGWVWVRVRLAIVQGVPELVVD